MDYKVNYPALAIHFTRFFHGFFMLGDSEVMKISSCFIPASAMDMWSDFNFHGSSISYLHLGRRYLTSPRGGPLRTSGFTEKAS